MRDQCSRQEREPRSITNQLVIITFCMDAVEAKVLASFEPAFLQAEVLHPESASFGALASWSLHTTPSPRRLPSLLPLSTPYLPAMPLCNSLCRPHGAGMTRSSAARCYG